MRNDPFVWYTVLLLQFRHDVPQRIHLMFGGVFEIEVTGQCYGYRVFVDVMHALFASTFIEPTARVRRVFGQTTVLLDRSIFSYQEVIGDVGVRVRRCFVPVPVTVLDGSCLDFHAADCGVMNDDIQRTIHLLSRCGGDYYSKISSSSPKKVGSCGSRDIGSELCSPCFWRSCVQPSTDPKFFSCSCFAEEIDWHASMSLRRQSRLRDVTYSHEMLYASS